jgi:hypothetical protein
MISVLRFLRSFAAILFVIVRVAPNDFPLAISEEDRIFGFLVYRAVAQLGSALEWGSRGRGFESRRPEEEQAKRADLQAIKTGQIESIELEVARAVW